MKAMALIVGLAALAALPLTRPIPTGPTTDTADITFTGTVTDGATGAPLAGVQVFLDDGLSGTLTNAAGVFTLVVSNEALLGTEVTLTAVAPGYAEASRTIAVSGRTVTAVFVLTASLNEHDSAVGADPRQTPADESRSASERRVGLGDRLEALIGPTRARAEAERAAQAPGSVVVGVVGAAGTVSNRATDSPRRHDLPGRYNPEFNTEAYDGVVDNPFLSAIDNPLSTFSIDVDRASYANVRRFINAGQLPPPEAVRIEEMINYFSYDYPDARGDDPFSVHTEVVRAPWNEDHRLVRIGIQGRKIDMSDAPPSNLVFLLDVSGSMQPENKLGLLKQGFRMLIGELRPQDRVAIVVYAGAAGLVLPSTSGGEKEVILDALESLEAGGSTAGGAGIRLAYEIAKENFIRGGNNRVILATDGDFNVGESSDGAMIRLVEEKRTEGTFLTVLGFGMGNLKDSKMEKLADHGNGNYAYIDNLLEARKVLVTEMGGTLLTIAKDVKLQIEFNPALIASYRLIGYENRLLAAEDFNDDSKDAGELGAGHTVTALYEVVPMGAEGGRPSASIDPLRYQRERAPDGSDRLTPESSDELLFLKLRYKAPDGERSSLIEHPVRDRIERASVDLKFAAAVAGFGMILRGSEHCGDLTLGHVLELAVEGQGTDREGYRAEFVRLVESTRALGLVERQPH